MEYVLPSPLAVLAVLTPLMLGAMTGYFTYRVKRGDHKVQIRNSDLESFVKVTAEWQELAEEYRDRWVKCEEQIKELNTKILEQTVAITKMESTIHSQERKIERLEERLTDNR